MLLVEPNSYRRDVAAGLGLRAVDPAVIDVAGAVRQWTGGAGAAVAFEVSGAQAGVDTAVEVLAVRGRLVMVAIHPTPRHVDLHRFFWRELTSSVPGSTGGRTSNGPSTSSRAARSPSSG